MTPAEHWDRFAEFCIYELAAGGPDPHMRYVGWASRDESWEERVWRAGIYTVGVYNFASAEAIWRHWPFEKALTDPDGLKAWIREHWGGLKLRRERRAIRTPGKFVEAILNYLWWADDLPAVTRTLHPDPERAYEEMWTEAMALAGVGRYAGFKLLETLTRYCELPIAMPDLRPRGGWSPRLTLAALEPELCREADAKADSPHRLAAAEQAAESARARMATEYGLAIDRYRFEVFLCDYRQSYEGRRQYPGRSNDSELVYAQAIADYWEAQPGGHETVLYEARAALTPDWARGEYANDWVGVRDDLGPYLTETGTTWSDWLYWYPSRKPKENNGPEALRDMARATLDAWPN